MDQHVASARDALRAALLSSKTFKPKSERLHLFGMDVEVKQQTLAEMATLNTNDDSTAVARMIVRFCYVPGTNDRIFEEGDIPTIQNWPFGEDVVKLQQTIARLQGINIEQAKEEVKNDPLGSGSST